MSRRAHRWLWAAPPLLLLVAAAFSAPSPRIKPVYIGAQACARCHATAASGHQFGKWMLAKHSRAWATLALPSSVEILRISGLRGAPQDQPVCLGCHAVAADAEPWQRDDDFRIEDGVQCEGCHGPGSEYANEKTMRDRKAAMMAGLRMPGERECMVCHIEKGTHTAVLKTAPFDFKKASAAIEHALPKVRTALPMAPEMPTGSFACTRCHEAADRGSQYSVWRMGPHARAAASLTSPRAKQYALAAGLKDDPAEAPTCRKCHAPAADGIGCESCHGDGSKHADDPSAAKPLRPAPKDCLRCHNPAHGKRFDAAAARKTIAHPAQRAASPSEPRYLNPLRLALRPNAREMYVTLESAGVVAVVDLATNAKVAEIPTGSAPTGIAFSPDGLAAYVSNREDDNVVVIDTRTRRVTRTLEAGDEPHGLLTSRDGSLLFVLNSSSDDIYVFDTATWQRRRVLKASRAPWSAALSPDGTALAITNTYSRLTPFRANMVSEITVLDAERAVIEDRRPVPGANLLTGIAWHPSGEFALAAMNRTKNLVPMTQLIQGWTITNGLAVLWRDGRVDQVLLDEPNLGFADATDVAFTPDGAYALVTSSGTNRVAVVDCTRLTALLKRATPEERERILPNHLGKSNDFIAGYIPTGHSPRGVVVSPDGRWAYVANSLSDSIGVIDLKSMTDAAPIRLGGPEEVTRTRFGELLFHNADITFRRQYSCHSCHPDGHVDGITYDIEADGIGISPVDNRTLRGILDTAPFKWEGTNPSLQRQCGARLAVFFTRNLPFSPDHLTALDRYVTTIRRPPNRYRAVGAKLTPAQQRGRAIFYREVGADGKPIPPEGRCYTCHPAPYYTDRLRHDVGTRHASDRQGMFDTPHLLNIYDSAPYLHNGIAHTLEEIWTLFNPYDKHGVTNDMTKDQLNDLIEFLKTL